MENKNANRFQTFFEEQAYIWAKRYIYNYHVRRRAVNKCMGPHKKRLVLETGAGVAPVVRDSTDVVYTDLSFTAVRFLKKEKKKAFLVVADGRHLPFKSDAFSHAVASEVLEHIEDDCAALREFSRVVCSRGELIITVPHKKFYYAIDDRYVAHFRRYEIEEIKSKLLDSGLKAVEIRKVLGPLEKITMWTVIGVLSILGKFPRLRLRKKKGRVKIPGPAFEKFLRSVFKWANRYYAGLARLDAKLMPMTLATVLVVKAIRSD
jgi:ubiquinone/menaquinone biosynthesis C-methylase UbiE